MKSRLDQTYPIAFTFTEEALKRFDQVLSKHTGGSISISATLSDNTTLSFNSVDDLLQFPNAVSRQIDRLRLESTTSWREQNQSDISIRFNRHSTTLSIAVDIVGEDEKLLVTKRDIEEIIEIISNRTQAIGRKIIFWTSVASIGLISIFSMGLFEFIKESKFPDYIILLAAVTALLIYTSLISWGYDATNLLRDKLFPIGTFAIGDGKRRHEILVNRRKNIFYSVIIAFLLSVLAAPLTTYFTGK